MPALLEFALLSVPRRELDILKAEISAMLREQRRKDEIKYDNIYFNVAT